MRAAALPAALAVLAAFPPLMLGKYGLHVATTTCIMASLAVSMNLMLRIGQLSMAHAAFMAIGAYTSALLTLRLGTPVPLAFLAAGAAAGAAALLLGPVFLRIRGVYFVLLTYAFGEIVNLTLQEWTSLSGGNGGLYGIPKPSLFGMRLTTPIANYLFALAFCVAAVLLVRWIYRSSVGAVLDALQEDEPLSRSLGVDALRWRIGVFGLSAALAGLSGSIYAHFLGFLSPAAFSFGVSVDLVVMNVIGGTGSAMGPLLGAIVIVPLPELLRDARQFQLLAYGLVLIVFLLFFRKGLAAWLPTTGRKAAA